MLRTHVDVQFRKHTEQRPCQPGGSQTGDQRVQDPDAQPYVNIAPSSCEEAMAIALKLRERVDLGPNSAIAALAQPEQPSRTRSAPGTASLFE